MTETKPRNIGATRKTKGNAMMVGVGRRRRLKRKTRDRTSFPFARKRPGESRETRIRQIEVCAPRSIRGRGSSEGDGRLAGQNEGPRETRLPPGAVRRGKQPLSSAVVAAADAPTTCACRARRLSSSSSLSPSSSSSSMVAPLPTGSPFGPSCERVIPETVRERKDILDEGCGVMGNWSRWRNRLALCENEVKLHSLQTRARAIQVHCENQFDWKSMNDESTNPLLTLSSRNEGSDFS
ncbi:hypothetical protein ALC62_04054 [Cyphomyrmex costatus]|uniref:Uncharacterized protein n=1 Tax=Cyphomyrmex costatus TaxID=456900 RepID=A0A195CWK7_9HYME|nr:hypothetical protein ALC62_04054 [Cyphomyrmex costatus]